MEAIKVVSLVGCALISFLIVAIEHYLPWQMILRKELPRLSAYIMGMLAIALPVTVHWTLFKSWTTSEIIISFWVITCAAGLGTLGCYILDGLIHNRARAEESEERESRLLDANRGQR